MEITIGDRVYGPTHIEFIKDGGGAGIDLTYIGYGGLNTTLTNQARYAIALLTEDNNTDITTIQWAGGVKDFSRIWDDRALYVYSMLKS